MTKLRAMDHLGISGGGWTEPKKVNLDKSATKTPISFVCSTLGERQDQRAANSRHRAETNHTLAVVQSNDNLKTFS
jgi:hypothetical protein